MDQHTLEQLGVGFGLLVVGISGIALPYRWNLLRLRRGIARYFSEATNRRIPKVIGAVLILAGLAVLVSTALGVRL